MTLLSVLSSNTWKISASSTLLREARDVDAIVSNSTEPEEETNIRTGISMTYFDIYAWIMFIHVQICVVSDLIKSGNKELLFLLHNAIYLRTGQHKCFGALRTAEG